MKGDILYTVLVNSDMKKIIIECRTINPKLSPDVGYETDDFSDFKVENWDEAITSEYGSLDEEKAFKTPGIYQIYCYHYEGSEPENGWYSEDRVLEFKKICELPYVSNRKAIEGDKIKLVKRVCYGSVYGLIEAEIGREFTVKNRNNSNDGVITVETIHLTGSPLGEKDDYINVWDDEYEIVN